MRFIIAIFCMLGIAAPAVAAEGLSGRYDLNMKESKWKNGPPLTGGYKVFEKDDGKTRRGYAVQYTPNGRLMTYIYDGVAYDGKFNWLNDWYSEALVRVDANSYRSDYKVQRDGIAQPFTGSLTCTVSQDRQRITCSNDDMLEVYDKVTAPR